MIVVEEEHEDARVLVGGGALFVGARADGALRFDRRRAVDLDEAERLDGLRLAVLEHLEVGLLQIDDRIALPVGDDRVDADEVDAGAEDRLLVGGRRGAGAVGWRRLRRRGLLRRLGRAAAVTISRIAIASPAPASRTVTHNAFPCRPVGRALRH